MTRFLDLEQRDQDQKKHPKLKSGIISAYIALLKAIASSDNQSLGLMTEANLFDAFNTGLHDLNFMTKEV